MDKDKILKKQLISLLKGGHAHMTLAEAVEDYPMDKINEIFPNGDYSSWHLLEHIRRTQNDILEFIINPKYKYKEWPKDYWPEKNEKAKEAQWKETVKKFHKDQDKLEKIIKNRKTDLYKKIPWGEGQNIIREIQTVADHNSYHIGEFAIMRQVMGTWSKGHK